MKCKLLTLILLICASCALAQNRIGLELGAARPLFIDGSNTTVQSNVRYVFTGEAYYLRKIARHWYLGAKTSFEQYSFEYEHTKSDGFSGNYGTDVVHKSSYLHFGPMIDLGVGKYREYLHVYVFSTLGFLLVGDQTTEDFYHILSNPNLAYDTTRNTHYRINSLALRIGIGFKQQFPLTKTWQATINEAFSFMPAGDLSQPDATGGVNLHPGYITLQFGVMHKFKDAYRRQNDR